jgi:hypothetical protein
MTYSVEQRGETERLNALLADLTPRPVEAHCETARSDDWLALIEACKEDDGND